MSTSLWGRELKGDLNGQRSTDFRRPPCEVVNWKDDNTFNLVVFDRRPPCEVVNWKLHCSKRNMVSARSTSLWGRELKVLSFLVIPPRRGVDLLVGSWIESTTCLNPAPLNPSTSLWGRELKVLYPIPSEPKPGRPPCEVVNWKFLILAAFVFLVSRPPCEVVNWKTQQMRKNQTADGRPPCEVVNWKIPPLSVLFLLSRRPPCEVVNWKVVCRYE